MGLHRSDWNSSAGSSRSMVREIDSATSDASEADACRLPDAPRAQARERASERSASELRTRAMRRGIVLLGGLYSKYLRVRPPRARIVQCCAGYLLELQADLRDRHLNDREGARLAVLVAACARRAVSRTPWPDKKTAQAEAEADCIRTARTRVGDRVGAREHLVQLIAAEARAGFWHSGIAGGSGIA